MSRTVKLRRDDLEACAKASYEAFVEAGENCGMFAPPSKEWSGVSPDVQQMHREGAAAVIGEYMDRVKVLRGGLGIGIPGDGS